SPPDPGPWTGAAAGAPARAAEGGKGRRGGDPRGAQAVEPLAGAAGDRRPARPGGGGGRPAGAPRRGTRPRPRASGARRGPRWSAPVGDAAGGRSRTLAGAARPLRHGERFLPPPAAPNGLHGGGVMTVPARPALSPPTPRSMRPAPGLAALLALVTAACG